MRPEGPETRDETNPGPIPDDPHPAPAPPPPQPRPADPRVFEIDAESPIPEPWRGAVVAIGNFDGVHRGHAALVERLRAMARRLGAPALVLTFDPPPLALLRPEAPLEPLATLPRRVELLLEAGADAVGVFRTGPWLLSLPAREFFDRVVRARLRARGMVEGFNFAFGRDRAGDTKRLAEWCAQTPEPIPFEEVPPARDIPAEADPNPDSDPNPDPATLPPVVSSSAIRAALRAGDVETAARMLGRPHEIEGVVVQGARRGREIGFPTANLDRVAALLPADGVYAAHALVLDQPGADTPPVPAAVHIGPNATFGEARRSVEAHLLDFRDDLYGKTLRLRVVRRVRATRPFESAEALVRQIRTDVENVRRALGLNPPDPDAANGPASPP